MRLGKAMTKAKEKQQNFSEETNPQAEALSENVYGSHPEPEVLETLTRELDAARQQAGENLDSWQRERADFINFRKRVERDQETLKQTITGLVIKKYLVILDDL
jgi:molecular chaperone GrpE